MSDSLITLRDVSRLYRRGAGVGDRLFRGDQIIGIDAVIDAKALPGAVRAAVASTSASSAERSATLESWGPVEWRSPA